MTGTTLTSGRGSRRRRVLIVALVAVLLLLLARTGLDMWARHRVDTEVSRLEQQYGSLDERTLNVAPVPQADNRARAVRAAAALTVLPPRTNYTDLSSAGTRLKTLPASAPVPADLAAIIETNRAALRVADEVRARGQSDWEADYTTFGSGSPPPWMEIRTLSHVIYLAARLDLHAGRPDDAAREIASGLAVSASVRQEPNLIAQLIRCAIGMQLFEAVQQLVIHAEPSKSSLEELSRWLIENRAPDPMQIGLLSELKHVNAMLTRAENGDVARMTGRSDSSSWLSPLAWLNRPLIRLFHLRSLEQLGHLLEVQMGPRPRPASPPAPAPPHWALLWRLDNMSLPGLERAMGSGDLFNGELAMTELAVALRRFRLDHGNYPDALSALAPDYVPRVPINPFTGQPPSYARQGAGFRLHADAGTSFPASSNPALDWVVVK